MALTERCSQSETSVLEWEGKCAALKAQCDRSQKECEDLVAGLLARDDSIASLKAKEAKAAREIDELSRNILNAQENEAKALAREMEMKSLLDTQVTVISSLIIKQNKSIISIFLFFLYF